MGVETQLLLKASTDKLQSAKYTGMLGQQQLSNESKKKQQVRERKTEKGVKSLKERKKKKECEECRTQSRTAALCTSLICRGGVQLVSQTAET